MNEQTIQAENSEVQQQTEINSAQVEDNNFQQADNENISSEENVLNNNTSSEVINDNSENAKKRIDRKNQRLRAENENIRRELNEIKSYIGNIQPQYPVQNYQPNNIEQNQQQIVDPITGHYLTPGTPRYDAVLYDQQKEMMRLYREKQQQQQIDSYYRSKHEEEFFDSIDNAADKYEDFEKVVRDNNLPLTDTMVNVAKIVPNGADFLYYLAKNPKEVSRISKLYPLEQEREMAKHFGHFMAKNNISKAPAPVQPVGQTSGGNGKPSFSKLADNPAAMRKHLRDMQMKKRR